MAGKGIIGVADYRMNGLCLFLKDSLHFDFIGIIQPVVTNFNAWAEPVIVLQLATGEAILAIDRQRSGILAGNLFGSREDFPACHA